MLRCWCAHPSIYVSDLAHTSNRPNPGQWMEKGEVVVWLLDTPNIRLHTVDGRTVSTSLPPPDTRRNRSTFQSEPSGLLPPPPPPSPPSPPVQPTHRLLPPQHPTPPTSQLENTSIPGSAWVVAQTEQPSHTLRRTGGQEGEILTLYDVMAVREVRAEIVQRLPPNHPFAHSPRVWFGGTPPSSLTLSGRCCLDRRRYAL
jgi:hypothetical protein